MPISLSKDIYNMTNASINQGASCRHLKDLQLIVLNCVVMLTFKEERAFVRATGANAEALTSDARTKRALNIVASDIIVTVVLNCLRPLLLMTDTIVTGAIWEIF